MLLRHPRAWVRECRGGGGVLGPFCDGTTLLSARKGANSCAPSAVVQKLKKEKEKKDTWCEAVLFLEKLGGERFKET